MAGQKPLKGTVERTRRHCGWAFGRMGGKRRGGIKYITLTGGGSEGIMRKQNHICLKKAAKNLHVAARGQARGKTGKRRGG